jgi:hypothetical protein
MIRDIALVSINIGQFPLAIVAAIILVILLKLPSEDVSKLVFRILEKFELLYLGGWMLSMLLVYFWYNNIKTLRKNQYKELNRLAKEKEDLQQFLMTEKAM